MQLWGSPRGVGSLALFRSSATGLLDDGLTAPARGRVTCQAVSNHRDQIA